MTTPTDREIREYLRIREPGTSHVQTLREMCACPEAVEWAATQPSLRQAWRVCKRGDWMLWWAEKAKVDRERLVWVSCQCARLALEYVPEGEERPRRAIETAEAWVLGRGGVTEDDVDAAAEDAFLVTRESYPASVKDAAWAAFDAVEAVTDTICAIASVIYVAQAAERAGDEERDVQAECATICRREWPTLPETP